MLVFYTEKGSIYRVQGETKAEAKANFQRHEALLQKYFDFDRHQLWAAKLEELNIPLEFEWNNAPGGSGFLQKTGAKEGDLCLDLFPNPMNTIAHASYDLYFTGVTFLGGNGVMDDHPQYEEFREYQEILRKVDIDFFGEYEAEKKELRLVAHWH